MADAKTEKQKVKEITDKLEEGLKELFDRDLPVYQLHEDGSETLIRERRQVTEYEGIFGIEKADWENEKSLLALQEELSEGRANKKAQLLYGDSDKYGIYQLKDIPEMRQFCFTGTESLKRMAFVLANTLQQESWDGRFSRDNKTWAAEFYKI
jgi:hypothetical protein